MALLTLQTPVSDKFNGQIKFMPVLRRSFDKLKLVVPTPFRAEEQVTKRLFRAVFHVNLHHETIKLIVLLSALMNKTRNWRAIYIVILQKHFQKLITVRLINENYENVVF